MGISGPELEDFREELERRKKDLLQLSNVAEEAASTVELDQQKVGRVSRMDAMQVQAMSIETNRRREIELTRIDTALQRIEDGEFGLCVSCDEEIALARLKADSSTPICIACANGSQQ